MKYLPLLWAGIWRRKGRTWLTLLSIINAFLLLGMLKSFTSGLDNIGGETAANSLMTRSKISMLEPLPVGLAEQIRMVPSVKGISPIVFFPTTYRNEVQGPMGLGVIPDQYFIANPQLKVSKADVAAMAQKRTGVLIGSGLVEKYGWQVGDRIPLKSMLWANRDGTSTWQFDVVGTFKPTSSTTGNSVFLINYDYIDEGRSAAKGTASFFSFRIANPADAAVISDRVDHLFANSPHETTTSTSAKLAQEQLSQIGDVGFVVNAIAGAVFFSLLFYIGTSMVQSVRERTPELATLKAMGFSDRAVLALIVAESLLLCLFGALVGLGLVEVLFPLAVKATGIAIKAKGVVPLGVMLAVGLALLGGLPSAIRAMRLSVVDALAGK